MLSSLVKSLLMVDYSTNLLIQHLLILVYKKWRYCNCSIQTKWMSSSDTCSHLCVKSAFQKQHIKSDNTDLVAVIRVVRVVLVTGLWRGGWWSSYQACAGLTGSLANSGPLVTGLWRSHPGVRW